MPTTADSPHIAPTPLAPSALPDARDVPGTTLDSVLEGGRAFELARGALVEMSGGTERGAANTLANLAGRWRLPTTAVGGFFLACLAAQNTDNPSRELVRRAVADASAAHHSTTYPGGEHVDRPDDSAPTNRVEGTSETPPLDGVYGLAFRGELDIATRPALEDAAADRPATTGTRLLDLRNLTFCDASGVRALATVHNHVASGGGRLHVRPPSALSARRMLHLAVANGWLPVEFACLDTP